MKEKVKNFKLRNKEIKCYKYKCVDSTNITATKAAIDGCAEGTTVIASEQTAGKGRLGRTFLSQKGGVYFSVVLRPTFSPTDVLFITVAAAVSAARAIENASGKKCDIKWVNDIYINGKKVCGILAEGSFTSDGDLNYAVLGVGINLFEPKNKFPKDLPLAGSVFHRKDVKIFKNRLKKQVVRDFLENFFEFYNNIQKKPFMAEYQRRSFLTGKEITYTQNGEIYSAVVEGVDENANLIVKSGGKIKALSYGEIQIVGMEQLLV